MAYTPTNWQCGDVVTAEALNKIEQGIASASGGSSPTAPLILNVETDETDPENPIVQITTPYSEIKAAYLSGRAVILDPVLVGKQYMSMIGMNDFNPGGKVVFLNSTGDGYDVFGADADADHPILMQDTNE